ncbi:PIN domain-containing protein [Streptomyces sp. NPDC058471]|uniref:PIN domain-containing protein n=1 Tax=Streptomyces sp. NPDC058471 TaxID=3346516 RepID=UPI003648D211
MIIDTGVFIAMERGALDPDVVLRDEDDPAIAAVAAAELLVGVHHAAGDARRKECSQFVERILEQTPVEDYTTDVARVHARLMTCVRQQGAPCGAHDLMIAATAIATSRTLVTRDTKARFGELPDVRVREI